MLERTAIERFVSTLWTKRTGRDRYAIRDEATADVIDHIERLYNPRCRHPTLGQVRHIFFVIWDWQGTT